MICDHNFKSGIAFNSLFFNDVCIPSDKNYIQFGTELIKVEKCTDCGYSILIPSEYGKPENCIAESIFKPYRTRRY